MSFNFCLSSITVCSRMCQNGGILNTGMCMCDCAGGFSGPNCGSECIMCGIRIYIFPGSSVLDV